MRIVPETIRFKIWINMLMTVIILAAVVITASYISNSQFITMSIYHQLEEAMEAKMQNGEKKDSIVNHSNWTPHFRIDWEEEGPVLSVDAAVRDRFFAKDDNNVIFAIMNAINGYSDNTVTGKLKLDDITVYFLVEAIGDNASMVFFDTLPAESIFRPAYFGILGMLLIIGFFTSGMLASKITKPINDLEQFADEIATRNWMTTVPTADTVEIRQLAGSLEKMKNALQELEERDRKFLQSASHDLKTPVMIIKGYAQAMKDGVTVHSEQSISTVLMDESVKLERRITQLLRLNTIGHTLEHEDQKEDISLDRLLRSLVKRFEVVKPEITWQFDADPVEVHGNAEALLVAFENLMENQIRYAVHHIWITCKAGSPNVINIGNDGPKFDTENVDALFDPYSKAADGNFGLGLSIVKQVVTAHKGQVSASNTNNGVEFTVTL